MWSLIKLVFGLVILAVSAYSVFLVDMGDSTMAGHFMEVWHAPVLQKKLEGAREGMKRELEERLAEAGEKAGRRAARDLTGSRDELTAKDREALEDVLEQVNDSR
jgi:hypothetical protein